MSLALRKIGISLTLGFVMTNSVIAADWYVSPSGQNWYPGNQAQPFQTISKAIQEAQSGDTIYVMDGTYRNSNYNFSKTLGVNPPNLNNQNVVTITKSGLTLKNAPGHSPVIDFDGAGGIKLNGGVNDTVIDGFEVIGPAASIAYSQAIANRDSAYNNGDPDNGTNHNYFSGRGIYGFGPHNNIIVRNCKVHDTPGSGIRLNDADNSTFEFNEVYNTTWWTHSASSAMVFAETIAAVGDTSTGIKMVMRGNTVYNNWNRIPFYSRTTVPNGNGPGGDYGTYAQNTVIDGQGLYVTRSDPSYAGTFLFENNIVFNSGKNGIHFDHSDAASGIIRNNTLYFNGSHNLIQLEEHGQLLHNGPNKVAGINSRNTAAVTITNNIVVTRDNQYTSIGLYNIPTKLVKNNLFVDASMSGTNMVGTSPLDPSNMLNIDPEFINPTIELATADFNLGANSPARNAGHSVYAAEKDVNGLLRPSGIAASTFESHTSGWDAFGDATLSLSSGTGISGSKSLLVQNRSAAWHGAKFVLTELSLVEGQQYNFVVNAKLASATSGTVQLSMKVGEDGNPFSNLTNPIAADNSNWTELSGSFTYTEDDPVQIYVKGPTDLSGYHLDNAILSVSGSTPVNLNDLVELGAYEYRIISDADSDTIEDFADNCPNDANLDQADQDQDGLGDVCDPDPNGDGIIELSFNFIPEQSSYGQNSFEFESSGYTLTVTSVKDGSPAKIANQGGVNNQGVNIDYGLGVKGASGDSGPWEITEGEGLVFSLSDGSGAVNFYNTAFNTPLNPADNSPIKNLYGNERVTLTFNGTTYTASGGQNVSIIDGSLASDGSSTWANELASSLTLTAAAEVAGSSPATGLRVSGLSMRIDTNPNTDADGDTVSDTLDNCPSTPNADQANLDNDEFGDACDNDRDGDGVNNDADVFPDNSAETLDSDSDTLGDNADNCPLISNLDQADVDQDGVGNVCDADADGDGVLNTFELALNTDPLDASDGAQAASDLLAGLSSGDEVTIPMMGGFGLFALAISIFGLGVFSRRQQ